MLGRQDKSKSRAGSMLVVAVTAVVCRQWRRIRLPADTSISLATGLDYSSGHYGSVRATDILVALSDVTVKTGDFQFTAALPYVTITGPAFLVVGAGGVPVVVNPGRTADKERKGFGDLNLSATYSVPSD